MKDLSQHIIPLRKMLQRCNRFELLLRYQFIINQKFEKYQVAQ
jgi:hypothetical protein